MSSKKNTVELRETYVSSTSQKKYQTFDDVIRSMTLPQKSPSNLNLYELCWSSMGF
jgi:hypothetical protein